MLWVEDLHWLDPASEGAMEMLTAGLLAPESAGSRILLLATTPEHRPVWSSRAEGLSLEPLALEDSRALLDDWLGADGALAPLQARIEARARGNPLFIEEMIRSLVERGVLRGERGAYGLAAPVEKVTLPETVQAVLASRIDRLADRDKNSAIGGYSKPHFCLVVPTAPTRSPRRRHPFTQFPDRTSPARSVSLPAPFAIPCLK